jgi:CheY-like chemotaxis protein
MLRNVLYAEDNRTSAELIRCLFALRPDWRLLVAHSGREALVIAARERVDLLLLDMHLGDMTALDVVRELDNEASPDLPPVVALSADAMPASVRAARLAGFDAYLTKPVDVHLLLRTIDRLLPPADVHAEIRGGLRNQ